MILNRKIIIVICLFSSLVFKTGKSHGEDFDINILDAISRISAINKVSKDSPAFVVGIKVGDILLKINDKEIYTNKDIFYYTQNSKAQTINVKVLRKNKVINFKLTPMINSSNEKNLGISLAKKCPPGLDKQGNKYTFDKLSSLGNFYADQFNLECKHNNNLKIYNYLKNLKKKSPYYDNKIVQKIYNTKIIARDYLRINSIFNFEKANEFYLEAYNLARENISIIKKPEKYGYNFTSKIDNHPGSIAFIIAQTNLNLYDFEINLEPYINYKRGLKYLTIASNENHSKALHKLGKIYLEGTFGVKINEKKAFNLIVKSIQLENTEANKDLADFYLLGKGGVKKNYSKTLMHYKLGGIHRYGIAEDYFDIAVLHKHKRLPEDPEEYYKWLSQDLVNFKTSSSIERTGYFAMLFLKNYSEAYKWYYICSSKIKSKDWNKNLFGYWDINIKKRCSKKISFLEKKLLTGKEIKDAKIAAKNWIKKKIN